MPLITVVCPHCSFQRDLPGDTLPDQPVRATCPQCRQIFTFIKAEAAVVKSHELHGQQQTAEAPPLPQEGPSVLSDNSHTEDPRPSSLRELMTVGELFSATWELYKRRWLLLLGIFLASGIACVAPPMLVAAVISGHAKGSFSGLVALFMVFGITIIFSALILCWGLAAAVTASVDETVGFRDAFERAKASWISLAWVSTLYSFIVGGASLLFIVPGILTGIWFFACAYLVVAENTRGMDALLKSKALVDGRFPAVAGRLALVWLLGTVLGTLPVIGVIFSLLMTPFSMLYSVVLYRNLSETAGTLSWSSTDGTKAAWLLLGLAGFVLVPLVLFTLAGVAFFSSMVPLFKMLLQNAHTGQQITILDPELLKRLLFP